ncbi:MAG: insulinase family protein [Syntrophobacteraceae bacterium]
MEDLTTYLAEMSEESMTSMHGFELLREQHIPELKTEAKLLRHTKTGAELLSLINDDENKVFAVSFRTPPKDSTGVAHILEHSVLCGSRKYPSKEPFVELLKGSLKTFLNAFTYPDKTCYPVASQNLQDFYNLIDVYLDAAFYPVITPFIFQQEGWHIELEAPENPLIFKGVVFNEMKGVYSSPDSVLAEYSQQSVFPDNTYGLDSGGNPRVIPSLSYEQFKAFHEQYYHPSNARFYFYGNDDPEQRLHILDTYLREFDQREVDSMITSQQPFNSPKDIVRSFAASGDETANTSTGSKGMVTVNWLLGDTADPKENLCMQFLEYILLGMTGSPLRKALIDSGLGDDLAGGGLEDELMQMYFSTGLKGVNPENMDRVEPLVLDTLKRISSEGADPETIEAAINTVEFGLRENNSGSFPRGLLLMLRALTAWLYDRDPIALLSFEKPLSEIKDAIALDQDFFPGLVRRLFLENNHRTTLFLKPDPELAHREQEAEAAHLEGIKQNLTAAELQAVIENTLTLKQLQEAPDSPEALAAIPTLKVSDLERTNKIIPVSPLERLDAKILYHDIFTSGIMYLDIALDLRSLPQKYLPYVPLFGRALTEIGTEKEDFVSLSKRISRKTGGISSQIFSSARESDGDIAVWLIVRAKSMIAQTGDLLDILRDVLLTVRLDNRERFRKMVLEEKARNEKKLIPGGHQMVGMRLRAHFDKADWAAEQMGGISYLEFVRDLSRKVDEDWPSVLAVLNEIKQLLVNRKTMLSNVTIDEASWSQLDSRVTDFLGTLPLDKAATLASSSWQPAHTPAFEGLIIPSQVNYVGKGLNLYELGFPFHGSYNVVSGYLRNSWLWERVRVQGGAYGAFCQLDRHSGTLTFVSYRDPNLMKTLEVFDKASDFLRQIQLTEAELTKAIIGAIGQIDSYLLPDAKGYMSMIRSMIGISEEDRQRIREEVLSTTADNFRDFAEAVEQVKDKGIVKVLGSQAGIESASADNPGWLNIKKVL